MVGHASGYDQDSLALSFAVRDLLRVEFHSIANVLGQFAIFGTHRQGKRFLSGRQGHVELIGGGIRGGQCVENPGILMIS